MPQSKTRKPHKHHHPEQHMPQAKKTKSAVGVAVGFCALIGLGIAWFAAGPSPLSLIIGAVVGGVIGYFAGKQMDETFAKK